MTTIAMKDAAPRTNVTARKVLGDEEFARISRDPYVSMTRSTVTKFWGKDDTRSENQIVGMFDAIAPLLDAGVTTMAGTAAPAPAAKPGAVSDAAAAAYQAMKERDAAAWQGKAQ